MRGDVALSERALEQALMRALAAQDAIAYFGPAALYRRKATRR